MSADVLIVLLLPFCAFGLAVAGGLTIRWLERRLAARLEMERLAAERAERLRALIEAAARATPVLREFERQVAQLRPAVERANRALQAWGDAMVGQVDAYLWRVYQAWGEAYGPSRDDRTRWLNDVALAIRSRSEAHRTLLREAAREARAADRQARALVRDAGR